MKSVKHTYEFDLGLQVFFVSLIHPHGFDFGPAAVPDSRIGPSFTAIFLQIIFRKVFWVGIYKLGCSREIRGSKYAIMAAHPATIWALGYTMSDNMAGTVALTWPHDIAA